MDQDHQDIEFKSLTPGLGIHKKKVVVDRRDERQAGGKIPKRGPSAQVFELAESPLSRSQSMDSPLPVARPKSNLKVPEKSVGEASVLGVVLASWVDVLVSATLVALELMISTALILDRPVEELFGMLQMIEFIAPVFVAHLFLYHLVSLVGFGGGVGDFTLPSRNEPMRVRQALSVACMRTIRGLSLGVIGSWRRPLEY